MTRRAGKSGTSRREQELLAAPVPSGGVARGPDSARHGKDFRAAYPGRCGRCGADFPVGAVIMVGVHGYEHRVCPQDWPADEVDT